MQYYCGDAIDVAKNNSIMALRHIIDPEAR
jgi:hypothetical protein